jgi:MFS transporter, DHA1 family, multidrug resistance protein
MAPLLIRESFFGRIVYVSSGRRIFNYREERPDFVLPERYDSGVAKMRHRTPPLPEPTPTEEPTLDDRRRSEAPTLVDPGSKRQSKDGDVEKQQRRTLETETQEVCKHPDTDVVDWYSSDDPECPMNVRNLSTLLVQIPP